MIKFGCRKFSYQQPCLFTPRALLGYVFDLVAADEESETMNGESDEENHIAAVAKQIADKRRHTEQVSTTTIEQLSLTQLCKYEQFL